MLDIYKVSIDSKKDLEHGNKYCTLIGKGRLSGLKNLSTKYGCYYLGNLDLVLNPSIAIIGSREGDNLDYKRVRKLIHGIQSWQQAINNQNPKYDLFVSKPINIVSGLAKGIDTFAHQLALSNHLKTIACLPTSINECYPRENAYLKEYIREEGLVLSCFELDSKLVKTHFIKRNKLIALLSDVIILVKADEESGTRHVLNEAIELNRRIIILKSLAEQHIKWIDALMPLAKADITILTDSDMLSDFLTKTYLELIKKEIKY